MAVYSNFFSSDEPSNSPYIIVLTLGKSFYISVSWLSQFKMKIWDFPGGPVVKTPCSQCRGPRFDI